MMFGRLYSMEEFEGYDPEKAEQYLLRAIRQDTMDGHMKHQWLVDLYQRQNRWQEAFEHLTLYHEFKEEIENKETRQKAQHYHHQKEIAEMEKRHAVEQAEAAAKQEAAELRAQMLNQQLEAKRAELAAQAMHTARQTEMLGRFRNELRSIIRQANKAEVAIRAVQEKLKELPCEAIDWTKFDAEFQQNYPEFKEKLLVKYPELTKMEVKICAMLKLKLTSEDMATLFCLSKRTVDTHRQNIRQKMQLPERGDLLAALDAL